MSPPPAPTSGATAPRESPAWPTPARGAGQSVGDATPRAPRTPAAPGAPGPLGTFAMLWAVLALAHQGAYPDSLFRPVGLVVCGAALWVLATPGSTLALLALAAAEAGHVALVGPANVSNHWTLVATVSLALLAHAAVLAVRTGGGPAAIARLDRDRLFREFAPTGRILLVILYGYAVLHKLNADYLDPAWSCAAQHYGSIRGRLPFLPDHPLAYGATIWGSLLLEAAIPVLLLVRRTRVPGLLAAMGFHFLLAFNPQHTFYDFSATVYALYYLFLPVAVWPAGAAAALRGGAAPRIRLAVALGLGIALAVGTALRLQPAPGTLGFDAIREGARVLWIAFAAVLLVRLVRAARTRDLVAEVRGADGLRPSAVWAWVFPALLLFHGFTPYLGLKTEASFAMFSNLRTEGERWNHAFLPPTLKRWGYQDDLVTVVASSDPGLARLAASGERYPWFQFRAVAAYASDDAALTYRRGDALVTVPRIGDRPEFARGPTRLERWYLGFRSVPPPGVRTACRH